MLAMGTAPLLGQSILTEQSTEANAKKRKAVSAAFYKDKLVKMTENVKSVLVDHIKLMDERYIQTGIG